MSESPDGPLHADDDPALADTPASSGPDPETPVTEDEPGPTPSRGACRTELRGWAGAHLHGAVRPRRRAARRGRPPSRWC